MLLKKQVLENVETFQEEFTMDELIEKMYFIEKVQEGIKQSENGQTISDEEFEKITKEWFK